EAWCWLLFVAQWKPQRISVANGRGQRVVITLERGQLSHSLRYMAANFGWSVKRVRTFLNRLKMDAQIDTQTGTPQTIISIRNYREYQKPESAKGTQTGTPWARHGHKVEESNNTVTVVGSEQRIREWQKSEAYKLAKDISALAGQSEEFEF